MTDPSKQPDSNSAPQEPSDQSEAVTGEATAAAGEQTPQETVGEPADSEASAAPDSAPDASPEPPTAQSVTPEPAASQPANDAPAPAEQVAPPQSQSSSAPAATAATPPEVAPQPSSPQAVAPQPVPPQPVAPTSNPYATGSGYGEPVPGAARPRGSRRGVLIAVGLLGVLLLVICGVVGFLFMSAESQDNAHQTGKCVTQSGNTAKPVDCDDDGAYRIVKRLNNTQSDSGCPASQTELYFVNESDDYVLCLKKN